MEFSMDFDAIIFIGPQGSGKGTQAKLFAGKLDFFYLGTGAMLREIATHDDALGKKVGRIINQGKMLDNAAILGIVEREIAATPRKRGIIFDGVPRRLAQAEYLMKFLKSMGRVNIATIYLSLPYDESMSRLMKRAKIEGRKDDTRERIEVRLGEYRRETVPMLDYLRKTTRFFEIDGMPPPDEVTRNISAALGT